MWLLVALTTLAVGGAWAHVALTYPPARKFDLDFLDNSRTKGPCGMPKGQSQTTLLAGSTFNVTWHLAYPHRGGFKLQVLDAQERPSMDLTPVNKDSDFVRTDATAQSYTVRLPADFTCRNCSVRLMRQASEWSDGYRFWSCADVDIVQKSEFTEECSGHGKHLQSKCQCNRLYYGPRCQYRDECQDDSDCGERGRCVDVKATTAPRHQCYCELGWFGPGCQKRSALRGSGDLNLASFTHKQLSPTFALYWRILREAGEIEIAMQVNGSSYAAVGWRPRSLTAECKNFPSLADPAGSAAAKKSIKQPEPKNTASGYPGAHAYAPRHDFSGMDCTDIVIGMARGTASRVWDYYTRDRSTPRFDTFWGGQDDLTAAMGFEKDGVTTIVFRKKLIATELTDHSILEEPMHVIWAQGQEIGRYHHNPKSGIELETVSVPEFYKPDELKYHGHGQQRGKTVINFYDEEKATDAGDKSEATAANSNKLDQCGTGHWRFPRGCEGAACEYEASWTVVGDSANFTVRTRHTELWTGIGFSLNQRMSQTDAVLGWVDRAGRSFLVDTWLNGYQAPALDTQKYVTHVAGRTADGVTEISFSRLLNTGDPMDVALNGAECPYLVFPVKGGSYNSESKKIRKHEEVPTLTAQRVCLRPCAPTGTGPTTPAPSPPSGRN